MIEANHPSVVKEEFIITDIVPSDDSIAEIEILPSTSKEIALKENSSAELEIFPSNNHFCLQRLVDFIIIQITLSQDLYKSR